MRQNLKYQAGVNLLEIMIVIAILGVLAGFALPMYNNYQKRTIAAEPTTGVMTMLADCFDKQEQGRCTGTTVCDKTSSSKYASISVTVSGTECKATVTFKKGNALYPTSAPAAPTYTVKMLKNKSYELERASVANIEDKFIPKQFAR